MSKTEKKPTKSGLAIVLSKLNVFKAAKFKQEQYPTDSEIAAEALFFAFQQDDIEEKTICDLGCGTGILGIGALLLGAKTVYFIDNDLNVLKILKDNVKSLKLENKAKIINKDVKEIGLGSVDVVIQNPPFGTRQKHADIEFLEKAFQIADVVYSFHKTSTLEYVRKFAEKNNFSSTHEIDYDFLLKATMEHHTRRVHRIKVSLLRFEKKAF